MNEFFKESGNKVGVRWLALAEQAAAKAGARTGLLVVAPPGEPLLSASASHYLSSDLDLASASDLEKIMTHPA